VFLAGCIEFYFRLAPPDNEDFLRVEDLPRHHIVNVGADLVVPGMFHVGHLLGKAAGSEKVNARLVIIGSDYKGDGLQAVGDGFDKAIFPEKSFVVLRQFKRPTALPCQAIFVGARRSIGAPILFKLFIL